ncbi:MAG: hypothetical protein KL863_23245 [Rhizobium sp.]|nr:hypothetical protein [Rhizobium sp.]
MRPSFFAFGFMLGALRGMFLSPVVGELTAVLIEMPIILVLCWLVASRIFPGRGLLPGQGIEIGLTAFLLLQIAESLLFGAIGPYGYVDNMLFYLGDLSPARVAGLIGQVLFAIIPFVQISRSSHDVS